MKRTFSWRIIHLIHNCVAHPLLPLADLCEDTKFYIIAGLIHGFHDLTNPTVDSFNKQTFKPRT